MTDKIKFKGRKQSVRGIIGLIFGIAAMAAFLVMIILGGVYYVNVNMVFGIIGMVSFALSIAGLVLGIKALNERDIFLQIPIAGVVINGISLIIYLVLYIFGIS